MGGDSLIFEEIEEEAEAVKAIYVHDTDDEVTVDTTQSPARMTCSLPGTLFAPLTLTCSSTYPLAALSVSVNSTGLSTKEHDDARRLESDLQKIADVQAQKGEAAMYPIVEAAREWTVAYRAAVPGGSSTEVAVCRFFQKGACKFGDRCKMRHPGYENLPHASKSAPQTLAQESARKSETEGYGREKKDKLRTASDVIKRILWDAAVDRTDFVVGYLDRFLGVVEKGFDAFDWENEIAAVDLFTLAIPRHRIHYFKYKGEKVWDKEIRLDNVFGSCGGRKLEEIVEARRVSSGSSEDNIADENDDDDNASTIAPSEATTENRVHRPMREDRPNMFICIPVDDPAIRDAIVGVQSSLVRSNPVLAEGCISPQSLHVTISMVRAVTEIQQQRLLRVSSLLRHFVRSYLDKPLVFNKGVECFRDRVVYAALDHHPGLERFVGAAQALLHAHGIPMPGNHDIFTAHMTIVKLNRAQSRAIPFIDRASYSPFANMNFGVSPVDIVQVCHMLGAGRDESGFYKRVTSIPKSTEAPSPQILKMSLEELDNVKEKVLVVMRGLPGSGKTTYLANTMKSGKEHGICSADHCFEVKAPDGTIRYYFDPTKLASAHARCFMRCAGFMEKGCPVVVLDNTNACRWQYEPYESLAAEHGYKVCICEMVCPSQSYMKAFNKRSVHDVPLDVSKAMTDTWEADDRAVLVQPMGIEEIQSEPHEESAIHNTPDVSDMCDVDESVDNVSFTGVLLDDESMKRLRDTFQPEMYTTHCEHMTISPFPTRSHLKAVAVGSGVTLKVTRRANDGKADTVAVQVVKGPQGLIDMISNKIPHVTLGTSRNVRPKHSNDVLKSCDYDVPLKASQEQIVLTGTVAVWVRVDKIRKPITMVQDLREHLNLSESGRRMITAINVWDFDGTLFQTCGRESFPIISGGKQWREQAFLSNPKSLQHPFINNETQLCTTFKADAHYMHTINVVLTGRQTKVAHAVRDVLEEHDIKPDLLICKKPSSGPTPKYKQEAVLDLLRRFPAVKEIKMWDDDESNIAAFKALEHNSEVTRRNIMVTVVDARHAMFSPSTYICRALNLVPRNQPSLDAALTGLDGIVKLWRRALAKELSDNHQVCSALGVVSETSQDDANFVERIACTYGSYPVLKDGDVDVCLLTPESISHARAVQMMAKELDEMSDEDKNSFNIDVARYIHTASRTRCPRVSTRAVVATTKATQMSIVEYDLVFVKAKTDSLFCRILSAQEPVRFCDPQFRSCIGSDSATAMAMDGVSQTESILAELGLERTRTNIGAVPSNSGKAKSFVIVTNAISVLLMAQGLKDNALAMVRTFHVMKMIIESGSMNTVKKHVLSADQLDRILVTTLAEIGKQADAHVDYWTDLLSPAVPSTFIEQTADLFRRLSIILRANPYKPCLGAFYNKPPKLTVGPRTTMCRVEMEGGGPDDEGWWRARTWVMARIPECVHTLSSAGCQLYAQFRSERVVSFACTPPDREGKAKLLHCMQKLNDDLSSHLSWLSCGSMTAALEQRPGQNNSPKQLVCHIRLT